MPNYDNLPASQVVSEEATEPAATDQLSAADRLDRAGWRRFIAGAALLATGGVGVAALSGLSTLHLLPGVVLPGTLTAGAVFAVAVAFLVSSTNRYRAGADIRRRVAQDQQAAAEPAPDTPITDLADLARLPGERPVMTAGFADGPDWKTAVGRAGRRPAPRHSRRRTRPSSAVLSAGADDALAHLNAALAEADLVRNTPPSPEQAGRWLTTSFPLGGPEDVR